MMNVATDMTASTSSSLGDALQNAASDNQDDVSKKMHLTINSPLADSTVHSLGYFISDFHSA